MNHKLNSRQNLILNSLVGGSMAMLDIPGVSRKTKGALRVTKIGIKSLDSLVVLSLIEGTGIVIGGRGEVIALTLAGRNLLENKI